MVPRDDGVDVGSCANEEASRREGEQVQGGRSQVRFGERLSVGFRSQIHRKYCSSIVKENGEKQLSVYVIHSLLTLMSVVQLYLEEKMVMVCHLVSADTIGYEKALGLDNQVQTFSLIA